MIRSGSTLGLLGHEFRLTWRGWFPRDAGGRLHGLPQLVITVIFLLVALWAGVARSPYLSRIDTATPIMAVIVGAVAAGLFTLMLSQTLIASVRAFYTRGDLDLLLSAPIAPTKVLGVRAVSMAISAAMIFALVLAPLLIPVVVTSRPHWLAAYGVLAALSMAATGLGLVVALGLMTTIGPRRTRTVAQLLAAVIGSAFFILSQLQNIVGGRRAGGFWTSLFGDVLDGGIVLPPVALWPARAVLAEPGPLLALLAAGAAVFIGAVLLVGRRFAADAAAAKGAEIGGRTRAPARTDHFRSGAFAAMLAKELRLLRRDPAMLSQVLLRALYLPPLVFVLVRNAGDAADPIMAGAAAGLVFMAGQVSASLSWITLSAEEAPELLAMSPARPRMIWRAKLAAGLIPLSLFFVIPLAVLAWLSPPTAAIAAAAGASAAVSAGWINIWLQKPGSRKDFRRRRGAGLAATIAELLVAFLWGAATYFAIVGQWAPAAVAVILPVVLLIVARRPEDAILRRLTEAAR